MPLFWTLVDCWNIKSDFRRANSQKTTWRTWNLFQLKGCRAIECHSLIIIINDKKRAKEWKRIEIPQQEVCGSILRCLRSEMDTAKPFNSNWALFLLQNWALPLISNHFWLLLGGRWKLSWNMKRNYQRAIIHHEALAWIAFKFDNICSKTSLSFVLNLSWIMRNSAWQCDEWKCCTIQMKLVWFWCTTNTFDLILIYFSHVHTQFA